MGVFVVVHELVRERQLFPRKGAGETRVDRAVEHHVVDPLRLIIIGEVGSLEALLTHPVIAQVDRGVVPRSASADHDHATGVAHEDGRGDGVLAGMLEHDPRAALLAEHIPDCLAEPADPLEPRVELLGVLPVREHAPVVERLAIDAALGAEGFAVIDLVVA